MVIYRYKVLWFVLGAIGLLIYAHSWLMRPKVNPHPAESTTIRGAFPFDRGLELRFQQSFYARNPLCKYTAKMFLVFPQARVSREVLLPSIPVTNLGGGNYEVKLFHDYFSAGFCDWSLRFILFRVFSEGRMVDGAALLGFPNVVNSLEFKCRYRKIGRADAVPRLVCLQNGNGVSRPNANDGEVNFIWKENGK